MKLNSISQSWQALLQRSRVVTIALLLPLFLTHCATASERVVDADGKPLEGVAIIETWSGDVWNPVDSRTRCFGSAIGFSDKNGNIPSLSNPSWWRGGDRNSRTIFKKGYMYMLKKLDVGMIVMEPNIDSYDKILYEVGSFPGACGGDAALKHDGICRYRKDVADEHIRLAKTSKQKFEAGGSKMLEIECETGKRLSIEERNAILREYKL
jgi:hypothetical protein